MTGYGWSLTENESVVVSVELKSLNSRNIEVSVRLPRHYVSQELAVRNLVTQRLQRGKASVSISVSSKLPPKAGSGGALIDQVYVQRLLAGLEPLVANGLVQPPDAAHLLQIPGVLIDEAETVDEAEWAFVQQGLTAALDGILASRRAEGAALEADLRARVRSIREGLARILPFEGERIEAIKTRLAERLAEWTTSSVGEQLKADDRFQHELIYYLERNDITEERVRLTTHLALFEQTLSAKESQGRKLGFVAQEMGREINTIGSKANHSGMQAVVIEMKDELEKIKEQLNNLV